MPSPRTRRLHSDLKSLDQLAADSSIFNFTPYGTPPDFYVLGFRGPSCHKPNPQGDVLVREDHEVHIRLGANYPRTMPDLAWKTPIFHPNISPNGVVCLGGYGTHWAPSLALDELCSMLWDMIRYENFDETSPYNREAAVWAKHQTQFTLPLDPRPLRDMLTAASSFSPSGERGSRRAQGTPPDCNNAHIVEAQLVAQSAPHPTPDIYFIE